MKNNFIKPYYNDVYIYVKNTFYFLPIKRKTLYLLKRFV